MSWTANATVQESADPTTGTLLLAEGTAITCDGDDQVTSVQVLVQPAQTHLTPGTVVTITGAC